MSKAEMSKAVQISGKTRKAVYERDDGECIFCQMGYKAEAEKRMDKFGYQGRQVMHYISRARGGLGIPQNLATGCIIHHMLYDNGSHGERKEMKPLFAEYLQGCYSDWDEKKLVYNKWADLEEVAQ